MNMVEMVARIISEQDRAEADESSDFADWHWEERAELAVEIIKALREPSDAMITAAYEAVETDDRWFIGDADDWCKSYRAAIGAAAVEGTVTAPASDKGNSVT